MYGIVFMGCIELHRLAVSLPCHCIPLQAVEKDKGKGKKGKGKKGKKGKKGVNSNY